jgi:hypothetical protein
LRLGLPRRGLVVVVIAAAVAAVVSSVIVALNRRPDAPVDGASIAIIPVAPIVIWPAIVVPISAAIAVTTPAVPVVVAQVIVAPIPSPATLNLSVILATAIEVAVAIEVTVSVIATVATAALGIAAAAVHELWRGDWRGAQNGGLESRGEGVNAIRRDIPSTRVQPCTL